MICFGKGVVGSMVLWITTWAGRRGRLSRYQRSAERAGRIYIPQDAPETNPSPQSTPDLFPSINKTARVPGEARVMIVPLTQKS